MGTKQVVKRRTKLSCLLVLLLFSAIYCGLLCSRWHLNRMRIAALEEQSAALIKLCAQNQALRNIREQVNELEGQRQDNRLLFRLRNEVALLQDVARLQSENLELRRANEQLEQAPETVAARQQIDMTELAEIGAAIMAYAQRNSDTLPEQFGQLKPYLPADVFPMLETNRFELLWRGELRNIANPTSTPVARGRAKDSQNQRVYLFADGHLEVKQDE